MATLQQKQQLINIIRGQQCRISLCKEMVNEYFDLYGKIDWNIAEEHMTREQLELVVMYDQHELNIIADINDALGRMGLTTDDIQERNPGWSWLDDLAEGRTQTPYMETAKGLVSICYEIN